MREDGSAIKLLAMLTVPTEFDPHHPCENLIWSLITIPRTGGGEGIGGSLGPAGHADSTNLQVLGSGRKWPQSFKHANILTPPSLTYSLTK